MGSRALGVSTCEKKQAALDCEAKQPPLLDRPVLPAPLTISPAPSHENLFLAARLTPPSVSASYTATAQPSAFVGAPAWVEDLANQLITEQRATTSKLIDY